MARSKPGMIVHNWYCVLIRQRGVSPVVKVVATAEQARESAAANAAEYGKCAKVSAHKCTVLIEGVEEVHGENGSVSETGRPVRLRESVFCVVRPVESAFGLHD